MDALKDVVLLDYTNYDDWSRENKAMLDNVRTWNFQHAVRYERGIMEDTRFKPARAATIISTTVSPEVLLRVPADNLLNAKKLLHHLEQLTRPFRFLDLPAELREQIYEHVLAVKTRDLALTSTICATKGVNKLRVYISPLPPITQTSRQLRCESRPIFFATHTFRLTLVLEDSVSVISNWAEQIAGADLQHLRTFAVLHRGPRADVKFSVEKGLTVEDPHSRPTERTFRDVSKHIDRVERIRKALGLKGESIIRLLTDDPTIWA